MGKPKQELNGCFMQLILGAICACLICIVVELRAVRIHMGQCVEALKERSIHEPRGTAGR